MRLTVATWNIHALRGASAERLRRIVAALDAHAPDILVLQEVSSRAQTVDTLRDELATAGYGYFSFSGPRVRRDARDKAYGNVLATRWPIESLAWPAAATWPQLLVAGSIATPQWPVTVVGAHIPNGSGNGWEKVYALESLAEGLAALSGARILAGDFNEPRSFEPALTSFGATDTGHTDGEFTDLFDITHPRARWQSAVDSVLHPDPTRNAWGGRFAALDAGVALEPTHLVRGKQKRWFDHILVAGDGLTVTDAAYDHAVREGAVRLSDHSLVTATVELA
ncbi:endonuclease/exonuclease/phosphatase family protein [Microbacterium hominis]|uniref:Endonuclease/exonuclease/phosphatase family protein n=1 Tax=Microbacterium hominis TaxID=162426 RepID=A0A7D4TLV3_9MICO|nr:endonuclease/exonuclease/phosphatase family protein [Microbacterium hominis]QKJ18582.1 endonuclease/exonuclease/phosphatase family protein [Microbacterium hominis]